MIQPAETIPREGSAGLRSAPEFFSPIGSAQSGPEQRQQQIFADRELAQQLQAGDFPNRNTNPLAQPRRRNPVVTPADYQAEWVDQSNEGMTTNAVGQIKRSDNHISNLETGGEVKANVDKDKRSRSDKSEKPNAVYTP